MQRVGIRQVAERAGVSVATVSNVLNKPELVSADTARRVLQVMDQIGFVRNGVARQLRTGGSKTLGMIVLNVANPFFADLAHACETAAESLGHTVLLGSSDQLREREDRYLQLFEEERVRGIIVASRGGGITPSMRRLRQRGVPVVFFDITDNSAAYCTVALDGRRGGYLAARHLIDTGRNRIVFLGGPLQQVEDRWIGAMRACAEVSGVQISHHDTPDQTTAHGRQAGRILAGLAETERPDAIFAANDLLALGALQGLQAHGLAVPHDVAVIGYDDIEYAETAAVPLSTIRQPVDQLAEEALRLVLDEAADAAHHEHENVLIRPELIIRNSTANR